jgi:AcrR family transcriptional regulator
VSIRQEQRRATRARVLDHAGRIVISEGFLKARTADVARAAGVSHGAIFVHFPTRDALLLAVARQFGHTVTDRLHQLVGEEATLGEVLAAHVRAIVEQEDAYRRLLLEGPFLGGEFAATWTLVQSAVSVHLARVAEREMAAGRIRTMPVSLLFNTWVGLIHHYLVNRDLFVPEGSVLWAHGPALIAHYLELLTPNGDQR